MLISFEGPITIDADRFPGRCVIEIDDLSCIGGSFQRDPACGVFQKAFGATDPLKAKRHSNRAYYEIHLQRNLGLENTAFRIVTIFQGGLATVTYTATVREFRRGRWSFSYTRCGDGTATVVVIPPVKRAR